MSRQPEGYSQWFNEACSKAARDGHLRMMRPEGFGREFFLWFGELFLEIAPDCPKEGACIAGLVPSDRTSEQLGMWVRDKAARLPILPTK